MSPSKEADNHLLSTWRLLKMTGHMYLRHFALFFGYAAWLLIPLVASLVFSLSFDTTIADVANIVFNVLLYSVLAAWLTVVVIKLTPLVATKKTIRTRRVSTESWLALIPFMLISLVTGLISALGFMALIIPGVLFSVWFAFAPTIVALEHKNMRDALNISRDLSRNRFSAIFWRLLIGSLVIGTCYIGVLILMTIIAVMLQGSDAQTYLLQSPSIVDEVLFRFIEILFIPAMIIYQTLLYLEVKATLDTP